MGSTYSDITTAVRTRVREPVANDWTDAEIRGYISEEERKLFDEQGMLVGSGRAVRQDEITIAASTASFALTTGTPPAALTSEFVAIDYLDWDDNGTWVPMKQVPHTQEWRFDTLNDADDSSLVRPTYLIRESTLYVKPTSAVARTLRLTYQYRPAVKSSAISTLDTPIRYDEEITARVAARCLEKLGQADQALAGRILVLQDQRERLEVNKQNRGRVETIRRTRR